MKLVRVRGVSRREKERRVLTLRQCHQLLAELEEPYRTMVALAIVTGLRCSIPQIADRQAWRSDHTIVRNRLFLFGIGRFL